MQELLRHATVKMTLEVYAQAVTPAKREAQSKVAGLLKARPNDSTLLLDCQIHHRVIGEAPAGMQECEGKAALVRGQTWTCLVQTSGPVCRRSGKRKASIGSPRPLRLPLSDHASNGTIPRWRQHRWRVKFRGTGSPPRPPIALCATETYFALKGGTAINLFVRALPRLSVDIDLVYLPIEDRKTSLVGIRSALSRIAQKIRKGIPESIVTDGATRTEP